jgi:C-terminal processing protease CtpA/Prc
VTDVTPKSVVSRAGIRVGDEIFAIDGQPVVGMKREAFDSWLASSVEPDRPKVITFVGKRGVFKKKRRQV